MSDKYEIVQKISDALGDGSLALAGQVFDVLLADGRIEYQKDSGLVLLEGINFFVEADKILEFDRTCFETDEELALERSSAFDSVGDIEEVARVVTVGTVVFSSSYLAGQYAFDSAIRANPIGQINGAVFGAHVDSLRDAGGVFHREKALEYAQRFLDLKKVG